MSQGASQENFKLVLKARRKKSFRQSKNSKKKKKSVLFIWYDQWFGFIEDSAIFNPCVKS